MPNDLHNLETEIGLNPSVSALGQQNALNVQATTAISQAQTALTNALNSIGQADAALNPGSIQAAQKELKVAAEMLDQAQATAVAANTPEQIEP